jgi:hypothetical protein
MDSKLVKLSRGEKILLVLYELSGKSHKSIRYEDIVVKAFETYPDDFHLKGYPQYPESGDLVHKPLYDFKKKGLVVAGNKMFALTEKGIVAIEALSKAISGHTVTNTERVTRDIEKEVARINKTTGFGLFVNGDADKIVDTDFFEYIGATVRTARNDFIGRLNTVSDVVKATKDKKTPVYIKLAEYHAFMVEKFDDIVKYKKEH